MTSRIVWCVLGVACRHAPPPSAAEPRPQYVTAVPVVDACAAPVDASVQGAPDASVAAVVRSPCDELADVTESTLRRAIPVAPHPGAAALRSVAQMRRAVEGPLRLLRCVEAEGAAWGFVFDEAEVAEGACFGSDCEPVHARVRFARLGRDRALTTARMELGMTPTGSALTGANCCHLYGTIEVDALRVWRGDDGAPRVLVHVTQEGNEGHRVESVALWRYAAEGFDPVVFLGRPVFQETVRSTSVWDAQDVDGDGLRDLLIHLPGRERCDPESEFCFHTRGPTRWARRLARDRWAAPASLPRGWRPEPRADE